MLSCTPHYFLVFWLIFWFQHFVLWILKPLGYGVGVQEWDFIRPYAAESQGVLICSLSLHPPNPTGPPPPVSSINFQWPNELGKKASCVTGIMLNLILLLRPAISYCILYEGALNPLSWQLVAFQLVRDPLFNSHNFGYL